VPNYIRVGRGERYSGLFRTTYRFFFFAGWTKVKDYAILIIGSISAVWTNELKKGAGDFELRLAA
jgi:hypothetical protein